MVQSLMIAAEPVSLTRLVLPTMALFVIVGEAL